MSRDYLTEPINHVRRADRAVDDDDWIRAFLHRAAIGTLATVYEGQPFINSNLYVYDEQANAIYMHTARLGRTRANMEINERVCFSITEMGRLLPADKAVSFSVEYAGVVAFGTGHVIIEQAAASSALQMLMDKYCPHLRPGEHYAPVAPEDLARTAVYAIQIESWSGKKKEVPQDFPNAFYYGQAM
jgi:nitroimidazol reductase NimA-like FMN-containing flavoprotein (pyridoxamine 5'-phosphate oxidase superfamily)